MGNDNEVSVLEFEMRKPSEGDNLWWNSKEHECLLRSLASVVEIGIHTEFKSQRRKDCGFDSRQRYGMMYAI